MATKKSGPRPMNPTAARFLGEDVPAPDAPEVPEAAGAGEEVAAAPTLEGMPTPSSSRRVRDHEPHALALAEHKVTSTTAPTKYTVLLDAITDDEFERLAQHAASSLGRIRTEGTRRGRYPSRSDVVRALVHLASANLELRDRMLDQIEKDVSS